MAKLREENIPSLVVGKGKPLIGLLLEENGELVERYFSSEEDARAAISDAAIQHALDVAGAWSDIDLDEMLDELDRIRQESPPSPPLDL